MPDRFVPRPSQKEILAYQKGTMGVSAVPGSGKTWTLSLLAATIIREGLLQPGEELKLHVTYSTVYLFVLEGKGIVVAGDEQQTADINTFVEIPPEVPHRLVNDSHQVFRVLNVKAPRPSKPTHLVAKS